MLSQGFKKYTQKAVRAKRKIYQRISHFLHQDKISNHRLIFCINSGRSGSNYLSDILDSALEVNSFHEPSPTMAGDYLNIIEKYDYKQSFRKRYFKVYSIKETFLHLPDKTVYCETNHMFIKTFFDVVIHGFPGQIEVIRLRRYLPKVLKSFMELGYFSENNRSWRFWMSSPNAVTSAIPCINDDKNLDACDLSIAYLIDIEARFLRFKTQYPTIKVHEIRLEQLNQFSNIQSFFSQLRITPSDATQDLCAKKINQREKNKKNQADLDYCKERIDLYINKAKLQGISIPQTLALNEKV